MVQSAPPTPAETDDETVLELPAGAGTPCALPFTNPNRPDDAAVDTAGNVYVLDAMNFQVLKLPVC